MYTYPPIWVRAKIFCNYRNGTLSKNDSVRSGKNEIIKIKFLVVTKKKIETS
jgi:hypothetical protein